MKVQFEEMFPWEFALALQQAPICYLPLGVLEWHGEHNAVGLDAISERIAERASALLAETSRAAE